MDHDRLFKQLLQNFFAEFLKLFLPAVTESIEPGSVTLLDKEVFTDLTAGERHEVDLLAKCRFRGKDAFFLVHVETQASAQGDFAERMFRYFARLTERHGLAVYPIALFTYEKPLRPEPDRYEVAFPDLDVLAYRFRTIQLNRLDWRAFARRPNPVAAALMTRMQIEPTDRPKVKLEILRLLVTLKLDKARQFLIRGFMDAYLRLNAAELVVYNLEAATIAPPEQEAVMQFLNEWEEIGEARGLAKGMAKRGAELVLRQLRFRFNGFPESLGRKVEALPSETLDELSCALFEFATIDDAAQWIVAAASE